MTTSIHGTPVISRPLLPKSRPVFIFGCPRSGTSLLTRILDRHSSLGIPYESQLYNRIYPLVRKHGGPSGAQGRERLVRELLKTDHIRHWSPAPALADTMAALDRDDFHGVVNALFSAWAAGQGKRRWGEKTPQHTLWWRAIREGFPDLQVVHLVRDGRDVALSYRAAHFGPKHVYHLAERWVAYLAAAEECQAALGPDGFQLLRYEDLLREPEGELRRVCAFLGEPFDPAMLDHHHDQAPYPTDPRNEANLRRPLLSENIEKWRTAMSGRELRIFEALAGGALERYGYPRAVPAARLARWEEWSCRFVEHPPRRLLAGLRNRQAFRLLRERLRFTFLFRVGAFRS